ncbi:amidase domain-containing protein [Clostridium sp. P21]|uniref:Amidase domain-containing protein n=1 Tax=Clostridium muellerianum TaxID=2716538 RepID=A0A7Y0HQ54_9CLOT|nr:amidase domain-containing protein [Clostridium muellerianum]NMM64875.1 amidase domain-containing protein [Clostridium muellerianum]
MKFYMTKKHRLINIKMIILAILTLLIYICNTNQVLSSNADCKEEIVSSIEKIFKIRNKAILDKNLEMVGSIYDRSTKYGNWAYEHEKKKINYIHNWEQKQGVKFTDISAKTVIRSIKGNGDKYTVNLLCSMEYKYIYENDPQLINISRIGMHHLLNIIDKDGVWLITKEWYEDPFADSLNLDNLKVDSIRQYISSQQSRDISNISSRRIKAVEYADQYCGAANDEVFGFKYNKKYRDYNPMGGDCANFASQILFEGGGFRKNSAWNYDNKGATRAWLNADGFKEYMIHSGRASVIAHGSYEKVYIEGYKLLPGDFVAYEKKGDVKHISVVTGVDSKGYPLVSCHNTDRNRVPWDLGWSDRNIRFWLIHVNY